ncbi:Cyclin-dependent kinase 11B, partial [Lachnellula arida]
MSSKAKSRWADDEDDAALEAQRKKEKDEKKRLKAEKQRKADEAALRLKQQQESQSQSQLQAQESEPPTKRRKLSPSPPPSPQLQAELPPAKLLRFPAPNWKKCRSVEDYEKLNDIEEGAYGWVSRAKDSKTGQVVALKRLKMDNANDGVPVTGLREIQTLMDCEHINIVGLREVVVGEDTRKIEKYDYALFLLLFMDLQDTILTQRNSIFLVLDFLEHDLKTLLEDMPEPFLPSETKTLLSQLVSGISYLHSNWILHRDLKTSNLLLNNRGVLKIADFGMARYFGDPSPKMTQLVVTLWYRAPELLLGASHYGRAVDMWSIGCIFGELLHKDALLPGKNEVDQLSRIFELCGIPTETSWPAFRRLPNARSLKLPK